MPRKKKADCKKKTARRVRRAQAASSVLAGQSVTAVARATRVTRKTVQRDLAHPETQRLMAALVAAHEKQLRSQFAHFLNVVDAGLKATKIERTGFKTYRKVVDHEKRLSAGDRLLKILTLGREEQVQGEEFQGWTWQQFLDQVVAVEQPELLEQDHPLITRS